MFINDVDLLALEPNLFRDYGWLGQRLSGGVGDLTDGVLTVPAPDVPFDYAQIDQGYVVTIAGVSYEVVSLQSGTDLGVSLLRADPNDPQLVPKNASGAACAVFTFRPQIAMMHRVLLRMAGVHPLNATPGAVPTEYNITNPEALKRIEALGVLHHIFAAAGTPGTPDAPAARRSADYLAMFREERGRVVVELDLNGDGKADAARRLNAIVLNRG